MENKLILVSSDTIGQGSKELGEVLIENFFTILKQNESLPKVIFLINSGVLLLSENNLVSPHLEELAAKGVEILACKTCLDYYKLTENLTIGNISTMKTLVELATTMEVITIN